MSTLAEITRRRLEADEAVDPYLAWAAATDFRYYGGGRNFSIAVAIECRSNVAALLADLETQRLHDDVQVPDLYRSDAVVDPARISYCTAHLRGADALVRLLPLVKRLELGCAVGPPSPAASRTPGPAVKKAVAADTTVIGFVDDFIGFADARLATHGQTRVRHVWSQDPVIPRQTDDDLWQASADIGYGYELSTTLPGAGSPSLSALRQAYPVVMPRRTHGVPVAHIAAGTGRLPECQAGIIAVHLPKRTLADSSGGALNVQALDGIRYIVERAGPEARVVVNLSYGTMAGPHDGTSIIEAAMDELIRERAGRLVIVVPAGNAYEAKCHACFALSASSAALLQWQIQPDDFTPSFMELWFEAGDGDDVEVTVTDPAGRTTTAGPSQRYGFLGRDKGTAAVSIVYPNRTANAEAGNVVLVAVAPTASLSAATTAAHGLWQVSVRQLSAASNGPAIVHAWIERDDQSHGRARGGRQSYFVDRNYVKCGGTPAEPEDSPDSTVQRQGSYNTIACGSETVVVGGYVGKSLAVAKYSGGGPLRTRAAGAGVRMAARRGPDTLACSEESVELKGLRAAAPGGVDTVRMNGTSVAVPLVVRTINAWLVTAPLSRKELAERLSGRRPTSPGKAGATAVAAPSDARRGFGPLTVPSA